MKYIRAREGYFSETFNENFSNVVRVLSRYGSISYRTVGLKSIIFPSATSAQVRINLMVTGQIKLAMDKIVYMEFDYFNLNMNEADRLINPLGFQVTLFRMNDENN